MLSRRYHYVINFRRSKAFMYSLQGSNPTAFHLFNFNQLQAVIKPKPTIAFRYPITPYQFATTIPFISKKNCVTVKIVKRIEIINFSVFISLPPHSTTTAADGLQYFGTLPNKRNNLHTRHTAYRHKDKAF